MRSAEKHLCSFSCMQLSTLCWDAVALCFCPLKLHAHVYNNSLTPRRTSKSEFRMTSSDKPARQADSIRHSKYEGCITAATRKFSDVMCVNNPQKPRLAQWMQIYTDDYHIMRKQNIYTTTNDEQLLKAYSRTHPYVRYMTNTQSIIVHHQMSDKLHTAQQSNGKNTSLITRHNTSDLRCCNLCQNIHTKYQFTTTTASRKVHDPN